MYSFAQRSDTRVVDEPFYGVYLSTTGVVHPGREDVLRGQPTIEGEVRRQLIAIHDRPVLFVKNMAHHMEVLDNPFINDAVDVILIRDPDLILSSYRKVIEHPSMRDIGIAFQHELFLRLTEAGKEAVVVDSAEILLNPEVVLSKLCQAIGIPFETGMLSWPAGPKPFDGVWAPFWYANVHKSTGFTGPISKRQPLPAYLAELGHEARIYYEKLRAFSLKA